MTGSPTPTAATAIVPFEDTAGGLADSLGRITVVQAPRAPGAHIRRRGEDAVVGDELLPAGTVIGALQAAAAAAAGVAEVVVTRLPRVAVISTGSELAAPGIAAAARTDPGVEQRTARGPRDRGGRRGRPARHACPTRATARSARSREAEALGADVVVFSGGVSAGAYEVVKNTLGDRHDLHEGADAARASRRASA